MSPKLTAAHQQLEDLLTPLTAGKRWIVAGEYASGVAPFVHWLQSRGATSVLGVVGSEDQDCDFDMVGLGGLLGTNLEEMGRFDKLLKAPPTRVRSALDAWDPHRHALVIAPQRTRSPSLLHRRTFGARPARWLGFEDKTELIGLLKQAGLEQHAQGVVVTSPDQVLEAARATTSGAGVSVWAATSQETQGRGQGLVLATSVPDATETARELLSRGSRVRGMPYIDGTPLRLIGMVHPTGVTSLPPIELLTLMPEPLDRFVYCGVSTLWRPRRAARVGPQLTANLGRLLRTQGFRGFFTVDGVLDGRCYTVTEVNARLGAGLGASLWRPSQAVNALPLLMLQHALVANAVPALAPEHRDAVMTLAASYQTAWAHLEVDSGPLRQVSRKSSGDDSPTWRMAYDGYAPTPTLDLRADYPTSRSTPVAESLAEAVNRYHAEIGLNAPAMRAQLAVSATDIAQRASS